VINDWGTERLALVLALNGYVLFSMHVSYREMAAAVSPIDLFAAREQMAISLVVGTSSWLAWESACRH
jgi:hypothetical protein